MKKQRLLFGLFLLFIVESATSFAQDERQAVAHSTSKCVSKLGYWVIESNVNTPKHNIVYFYNNDNVLVYNETIDGDVLNLNKRRTKMRLKKMVEQKVTAYVETQKESEDQMRMANLSKK